MAWLIRRKTVVGPACIQNLSRLAQRIEDEHIPVKAPALFSGILITG
jgi:hypothetical protein